MVSAKKLVSIRLSDDQINFIEKVSGASFSVKLCKLIDEYDFHDLDWQRRQAKDKIKELRRRYIDLKKKLIKSTSKVADLIATIKWE